jgi:hypothetical protein
MKKINTVAKIPNKNVLIEISAFQHIVKVVLYNIFLLYKIVKHL